MVTFRNSYARKQYLPDIVCAGALVVNVLGVSDLYANYGAGAGYYWRCVVSREERFRNLVRGSWLVVRGYVDALPLN